MSVPKTSSEVWHILEVRTSPAAAVLGGELAFYEGTFEKARRLLAKDDE